MIADIHLHQQTQNHGSEVAQYIKHAPLNVTLSHLTSKA